MDDSGVPLRGRQAPSSNGWRVVTVDAAVAIVAYDEAFPLDELNTFHRNPRRGDIATIRDSLRTNGLYRALVVNRGTHTGRPNEILAGNHTYAAMLAEQWSACAVTWVDVDDATANRIVVVDNRASDKATNDADVLAGLLVDIGDLAGTGYTADDLAKLVPSDEDVDTGPALEDQAFRILVECRDEDHQADLLERFETEGLICRPIMM